MKNYNELPFTLTVNDISNLLDINKTKAYNISRLNDFPSIRIGRRIIIPRDQFLKWVEQSSKDNFEIDGI